jgi:hypothetical protein
MSLHPMQERVPAGPAVTMALFVGLVAALSLGLILFELLPPTGWYQDHSFKAPISWFIPFAVGDIDNAWRNSFEMAPLARLNSLPAIEWTD